MTEKRQIVNIVNFIRACEPRCDVDLLTPVKEQIRLMKQYGLRGTFLVQYDTLCTPAFTELLKELDPRRFELGVWHEIVQPLTEAVGIPWTGRFPWDWHAHCGFSVGYTKPQRERLCDELFRKFREVFGYYPRVFGSWFFDSHTLSYLCDTYGLDAVCNCKEQYGTDGYTLWGGYYGQGYYPARGNCFMPAQTSAAQLPVPLFRMLGSDPVYQYDFGMDAQRGAEQVQGVVTLEPVYCGGTGGGGVPKWVDWYLKENFNGECLTFGYAQAGQENAFGWPAMGEGLTYQFRRFADLSREGKLEVEPLGETGRWFRQTYSATPASAITAHTAFDDPEISSVWYSSKYYRANIFCSHGALRIRDIHVFSERYPDPFDNTVCMANEATYESLPVTDGNRFTGNGTVAGIYPEPLAGDAFAVQPLVFREEGQGRTVLTYGEFTVTLTENALRISAPRDFRLVHRIGKANDHLPGVTGFSPQRLTLTYGGAAYGVTLTQGTFADAKTVISQNGAAEANFDEP